MFGTTSTETDCEETAPLLGGSSSSSSSKKDTRYDLTQFLPPPSYRYPVAVVFVLVTKFFEAFSANGIRTILALFLRDDLFFSENLSTIMLHVFNFFAQFCPIFGAIIADSYLGNVRTISLFCSIYAFGWGFMILTSFPSFGVSATVLVSISLLLISIGNGSIRACITSLGALQFKVPEQSHQLAEYFSLYYFAYYFGIFLSKIFPPMIRANTTCFNKAGCYPAVFGTLGSSFLASWFFFTLGKMYYRPEKLSEENILVKFYGCIRHALVTKCSRGSARRAYWLEHAVGRYDETFVCDVSKVLKISKLFIPLPIYFALLAQQDSSWTFQATQMNTTIGTVTIQADQAKAMGPVFLFVLIPLWSYILAPILKRCRIEMNALQSVTVGGVCSAFSFICAGVLQEYIYTEPVKSINIVWQVPQFLLLMMGELFLSIPGLQFAFTQAPLSMKSVVTAAWFLNNAFGNLIVVLITEIDIFQSQSAEYFFYAVLMIICIIVFALLAYEYLLEQRVPSEENLYQIEDTNQQIVKNLSSNSLINENM